MKPIVKICLYIGALLLAFGIYRLLVPTQPIANFSANQVEYVEVYRFVVPSDALGRTITNPDDIQKAVRTLTGLKFRGPADQEDVQLGELTGAEVTSFRFCMKDGSTFTCAQTADFLIHDGQYYKNNHDSLQNLWDIATQEQTVTQDMLPQVQ